MHPSAYHFATTALTEDDVKGQHVVEAGGLNVNGSARSAIEALCPASYLATDMREGPGVDQVCPAEDLPGALPRRAGIVISTEMLEHAADWGAAVRGMVGALAPGGLLLLTARGPGFPVHGYPEDHWRFTPEMMSQILGACRLETLRCEPDSDPHSPGVFVLARKPPRWRRPPRWEDALAGITVGLPG